jgi:SAM-dependent methyltransferase
VEGESARPNAQCPRCGAVERHRLIWLFLRDCTNLFSEKLKLLHIAPEPVFQRKFKSMSNLEYISADINSPLADVKMDITDIDYEDGVFDAILCSHVLDYVSDDIKALCELFRILKRGGWAILQSRIDKDREITFEDPSINTPEKKKLAFGQSDLCRIYGRDYIERIKSVGFQVREEAYGSVLGAEQCARYGLIEGEPVYFCLKPEN